MMFLDRQRSPRSKNLRPLTVTPVTFAAMVGLLTLASTAPATAQADFSWDPQSPEIAETVTFTIADPAAMPVSWDFGGTDCEGNPGVLDCRWIPDYCRNITWHYSQPGAKTVTLTTDQGMTTHMIEIQNSGECCLKDGPPSAAFSISPNPTYTGRTVVFTDLSTKSALNQAKDDIDLDFEISPQNPEIGELVVFTLTGVSSVESAEWNFGGEGCGNLPTEYVCEPYFTNCLAATHIYAGSGEKTVTLTINGGLYETAHVVTVQNEGHCSGGGDCFYLLDPTSRTFGHTGGSDSISVSSGPSCQWTALSSAGWINIIAGDSGTGNGSVAYTVEPNSNGLRSGRIVVEGRNHTIIQEAYDDGDPGDTAPTDWLWTISATDQDAITSDQPSFSHSFDTPGLYHVQLEVSNCKGRDVERAVLVIEDPPASADGWVVPSAVHAPGLHQTRWRTDLWIFNPGETPVDLDVEFLLEDHDNWLVDHPTLEITIPAEGTAALEDVLLLIPDLVVDDEAVVGSLLISRPADDLQPAPVITSRTFNQTPDGTFGQFVPAASVPANAPDRLYLTGLSHNSASRTNVRLANLGTEAVDVRLYVLAEDGQPLGQPVTRTVLPLSTTQVNGIAEVSWAGTDLDIFSVRVDTDVDDVLAWASVVDNRTGDPVLFNALSANAASRNLWIPGVAHLDGANDSQWRSDITVINPALFPLDSDLTYVPSEDTDVLPSLEINNLQPPQALFFPDVLAGEFLAPGAESKGYLAVTGTGHEPPLEVAARTYNLDPSGGTYGQNLHIFDGTDLLMGGHQAFIPGVMLSAEETEGFRTNLGLLNLDDAQAAEIELTLFNEQGLVAGNQVTLWLTAGQLIQFNLASRLGLHGVDVQGTVMIEHLSGAAVVAYASVIDNRTQDPILIPAAPNLP